MVGIQLAGVPLGLNNNLYHTKGNTQATDHDMDKH